MVGGATIALAQADVVKERQENRKQTAAAMRAIKGVIDAKGPTAGAVEQAAKLKTLEAAFVKLFPAGSDKDETKALPTVWSDWPASRRPARRWMPPTTSSPSRRARATMAALTAAFGDTGKACGACHDKFRAKAN